MGGRLAEAPRRQAPWSSVSGRGKPTPLRARKKSRRAWRWFAIALLLSSAAGTLLAVAAYQHYSALYRQDMAVAQDAEQRLRAAEALLNTLPKNPFDTATLTRARQEFAAAGQDFTRLEASLNTLPAISTALPVYGARVAAAQHLAALASDLSRSGEIGCTLLQTLSGSAIHLEPTRTPLAAQKGGMTRTTVAQLDGDARLIEAAINAAIGEARQVSPADVQFDARLASLLATFQGDIPLIQSWMSDINAFLAIAPSVLGIGSPANFLIEVLDSTELRPGGGFIGNYGIATIANGRLTAAHITDVDLLDRPFAFAGHTILFPPDFVWFSHFISPGGWSLRDSNLSADFPTSARAGEDNYHVEGGNVPVQGVIAITPAFIEGILRITGPVAVPEYGEVVSAQNLIDMIHYYQLGAGRVTEGKGLDYVPAPGGHSSERKQFTELLAEHLFARVHQLSAAANARLFELLVTSLRTKDVQVYFNQAAAEKLLQNAHLDAAIEAPAEGDSLFVVNANLSSNKANRYISSAINDTVTIDSAGDALHQTTLRYAWTTPGNVYGNPTYTDYIHIYVPPGSVLYAAEGWTPQGTSTANGREMWQGYFRFTFGQTRSIHLTWMVHSAAQRIVTTLTGTTTTSTIPTRGAATCRYQELIQRQAGSRVTVNQQIALPGAITSIQGGPTQSGPDVAALHEALTEDLTATIEYAC